MYMYIQPLPEPTLLEKCTIQIGGTCIFCFYILSFSFFCVRNAEMALNKFMHPRNRYRKNKPDYKALAVEYPDFRRHVTIDLTGKVWVDYKDPQALRALSSTLLKHDFNLEVHLPLNRLIPTVPLRLNYIHWLEDIVGSRDSVRGIDIGNVHVELLVKSSLIADNETVCTCEI